VTSHFFFYSDLFLLHHSLFADGQDSLINTITGSGYKRTTISTMALSTLAQLAEQSKQLTSHIGGLQVPQIKRGIDQIESQSRKLAAKASKPTDGIDNKGYVARRKSNSIT
jgi:hypothetical protein